LAWQRIELGQTRTGKNTKYRNTTGLLPRTN
jgi:hypothetical protein